jgi:hypothetical protein
MQCGQPGVDAGGWRACDRRDPRSLSFLSSGLRVKCLWVHCVLPHPQGDRVTPLAVVCGVSAPSQTTFTLGPLLGLPGPLSSVSAS